MNVKTLRDLYNKISDMGSDYRNATDLTKMIAQVSMEAEDNARHTDGIEFYVEGTSYVSDDGLLAWEASIETILACCDFPTEESREWFTAQGIRF